MNVLSLSPKFTLFACLVEMDMNPLNSFLLPIGTETLQVEDGGESLQEEGGFASWFPRTTWTAASPGPCCYTRHGFPLLHDTAATSSHQLPLASVPLECFIVECAQWETYPRRAFQETLEGGSPASSRGHISSKFCWHNPRAISPLFSEPCRCLPHRGLDLS